MIHTGAAGVFGQSATGSGNIILLIVTLLTTGSHCIPSENDDLGSNYTHCLYVKVNTEENGMN